MIFVKTPFRISFFGGGTDYPTWYRKHGGQVLSTAIDKYCYITLRYLPPFFEHRTRVVYSKVECVQSNNQIVHPAVRETLRKMGIDRGVEIHHDGDLPARSGMGSSSSFMVGLLHALYSLKGRMPGKRQLAEEAIHLEQEVLCETVGSQDQVAAAYGGLNHIIFNTDGQIQVCPLTITSERRQELEAHLMLFYTGILRTASNVAQSYVQDIEKKELVIKQMHAMVDEGIEVLQSNRCICGFGELLNKAWEAKRSLSTQISNREVDSLYNRSIENGAIGGKITGAGGGGFLLLFVPPSAQRRVRQSLADLLHVPFKFENSGSQVIYYDPDTPDFQLAEHDRLGRSLKCFRELETVWESEKGEPS